MSDLGSDEAFELKLVFLRELAAGHASAKPAHDRLRSDPADGESIQVLRNFFHKIAGTAAAVDLALLGRLASTCESTCEALLEGSVAPSKRTVQILGEGVAGVASVLAGDVRAEEPAPSAEPPLLAPGGGPSRILVIDDDPFSARLVDSVLHAAGFASSYCCEPEKAFEAILHENPDLIILDVVMPQMDGFRLCQRIRAHPGLQLTPVVFVTRKGDVEQRVRGLQVGGNDYIAKPFEPRELVARVRSHLHRLSELREMAVRDGLTRCYNNKYFKARLEQEMERARRQKLDLTIAMLDIDHFRRINDSYGHQAGDAVLSNLASILIASMRSPDVVARYGGEEFGILLLEAAVPEATIIMNRLRERIARHRFEVPAVGGDPLTLGCTVSAGLAAFAPNDTAHSMVQRADSALYEAKNTGRNRLWVAPN